MVFYSLNGRVDHWKPAGKRPDSTYRIGYHPRCGVTCATTLDYNYRRPCDVCGRNYGETGETQVATIPTLQTLLEAVGGVE